MDSREEERDWGGLRMRRAAARASHSIDDGQSRFTTAVVIFVAVVIAYPWYSYAVHSRLMARDIAAGLAQVSADVDSSSAVAAHRSDDGRGRQTSMTDPIDRHAAARHRLDVVQVKGASDGRAGTVVVVELGAVGVAESAARICQQAAGFVGYGLEGQVVRVQRYRGTRPATDAGQIRC